MGEGMKPKRIGGDGPDRGRFAPTDIFDNYDPIPESGCWIWRGGRHVWGYGKASRIQNGKKVTISAHRMFYEHFSGPIAAGLCVLHKCDTPICVNPTHLYLGSHARNSGDKVNRKRSAFGQKNARSVLTNEQALEIFHSRDHHSVLQKRYGIGYCTIRNIKTGKNWYQVTGHPGEKRRRKAHLKEGVCEELDKLLAGVVA